MWRFSSVVTVFLISLAFTTQGTAQGWYVSGNIGASTLNNSLLEERAGGLSATGELEFDRGIAVAGAVGYQTGSWRIEGELSYRENDIDQLTVDSLNVGGITLIGLGTFSVDGEFEKFGIMGNVWYDASMGQDWIGSFGAGLGTARIGAEIKNIGGAAITFDEDDWVFAYQFGAGIGYKVSANATVSLDYRLFGTSDPEFETAGVTNEVEYLNHSIMAGVRYRF